MSSKKVLGESDLIFSSASFALKNALGELKRNHQSVGKRLRSIYSDATFVQSVADAYNLPLVANERCGSWYIPQDASVGFAHSKKGSAYFKSTDGHFGQWSFSLRRLNLQVLDLIGQHGGCIIVDSTRKGKSMPDALSKTVPIWATTLNRLLFPDERDFHSLQVPGDVVSASEAQQIDLRIDGFLTQLGTLELDIVALRAQLQERPMRCVWQRPGDITSSDGCDRSRHNTIVLCTASNFTSTEASTDLNYIQGAADDHETWSLGLDAASFWTHCERFLNSAEQDLPELVAAVMAESPHSRVVNPPVLIKPTKMLWLGDEASADVHASDFDLVISCTMSPQDALAKQFKKRYLCLPCTTGKLGSRQLRTELSRIEELSELGNFKIEPSPQKILVTCPSGTDLAVGIALAIVCRFGTETGSLDLNQAAPRINKDIIKHRLSWIMISAPHVKPSRATLQSVNAFLMSD